MKRLLIFVALFPLFCLLSLVMIGGSPHPSEILELVVMAYALMVVPAILIGLIDRALKQTWGVALCALVGFVSASGVMYALLRGPNRFGLYETAFFGGIGAMSATLCWLIARMLKQRERTM